MEDLDERFFPNRLRWIAMVLGAVGVAFAVFATRPAKLEPPDITGCYSARGAPDIVIDARYITVLQAGPIRRAYQLEYAKGWDIRVEPGFAWVGRSEGPIRVVDGFSHGQFLFLSRQFEPMPVPLGFDLTDSSRERAIRYRRAGAICGVRAQF